MEKKISSPGMPTIITSTEPELLTFNALLQLMGRRSRQGIYDLMKRDETFPRARRISEFSIAWEKTEVMAWIRSRPRAELNGLSAVENRRQSRKGIAS